MGSIPSRRKLRRMAETDLYAFRSLRAELTHLRTQLTETETRSATDLALVDRAYRVRAI
jgi:hypothetical protein